MFKVFALYKTPDDAAAFDAHYKNIHTPLAMKMPGLRKLEVAKLTGTIPPGGEPPYYQIAEMWFDNAEAAKAALSSPEGRAAGKDVMSFAGKLITMVNAEIV